MRTLISAEELAAALTGSGDIRVLDVRWRLGGPGLQWRPYFQVANAYNRKNVFWYYDYQFSARATRRGFPQVPLVPTFGVEVSW